MVVSVFAHKKKKNDDDNNDNVTFFLSSAGARPYYKSAWKIYTSIEHGRAATYMYI